MRTSSISLHSPESSGDRGQDDNGDKDDDGDQDDEGQDDDGDEDEDGEQDDGDKKRWWPRRLSPSQ